jgi:hypothetical protein
MKTARSALPDGTFSERTSLQISSTRIVFDSCWGGIERSSIVSKKRDDLPPVVLGDASPIVLPSFDGLMCYPKNPSDLDMSHPPVDPHQAELFAERLRMRRRSFFQPPIWRRIGKLGHNRPITNIQQCHAGCFQPPPFPHHAASAPTPPVAELGFVSRRCISPVTTVNKEHWLRSPTQIRKFRAMNSLILAIPCLLLFALLQSPVDYIRPRLNASGHQMFRPNGRPAWEHDWPSELREQWAPYSCLCLGVFFIVRAAFIRFRPSSTPQPNDRNG